MEVIYYALPYFPIKCNEVQVESIPALGTRMCFTILFLLCCLLSPCPCKLYNWLEGVQKGAWSVNAARNTPNWHIWLSDGTQLQILQHGGSALLYLITFKLFKRIYHFFLVSIFIQCSPYITLAFILTFKIKNRPRPRTTNLAAENSELLFWQFWSSSALSIYISPCY